MWWLNVFKNWKQKVLCTLDYSKRFQFWIFEAKQKCEEYSKKTCYVSPSNTRINVLFAVSDVSTVRWQFKWFAIMNMCGILQEECFRWLMKDHKLLCYTLKITQQRPGHILMWHTSQHVRNSKNMFHLSLTALLLGI